MVSFILIYIVYYFINIQTLHTLVHTTVINFRTNLTTKVIILIIGTWFPVWNFLYNKPFYMKPLNDFVYIAMTELCQV